MKALFLVFLVMITGCQENPPKDNDVKIKVTGSAVTK